MSRARAIPRDLLAHDRPRSDEAHLALQHVPQLRQLVEARLAEEATDTRNARVVPELVVAIPLFLQLRTLFQELLEDLVGVFDHRGEFAALEASAAPPDPRMAVDHRTAFRPQQYAHSDDEREKYDTKHERSDDIECALAAPFDPIGCSVPYRASCTDARDPSLRLIPSGERAEDRPRDRARLIHVTSLE